MHAHYAASKACPGCGSTNSRLVVTKREKDDSIISVRKCSVCRLHYLEDPTLRTTEELYGYYSRYLHKSKEEIYNPITLRRYERLLETFGAMVSGKDLLDVGCGRGALVEVAAKSGWDVLGIELSEAAVALCRRLGLPVEHTDFLSSELGPASFDVICMSELIEHVDQPRLFIKRAEELLRPEGLLYVTTPNYQSLDRKLLGVHWHAITRKHLTYFTPRTLKNMIRAHSTLEIKRIGSRNFSPGALTHFLKYKLFPTEQAGDAKSQSNDLWERQQELRGRVERSGYLRALKIVLNRILSATGLGSTLYCLCRKSGA